MRKITVIIFMLISSFDLFSQGSISGRLVDKEDFEPIIFSSVVLYNNSDSVITGVISDEKGAFEFNQIPFGSYYIESNSITHDKWKSTVFNLSKESPKKQFSDISLSSSAIIIEEVEIETEKSVVKIEPAKKTFDAAATGVQNGGTAVDVLNNLPSVDVDQDGNVSLRGNSNLRILIDGKPIGLSGDDVNMVISQLPANSVERIEVITVPSAKYDPEGVGGIINIILKKEKRKGFNGSLNASYGAIDQLNIRNKSSVSAGVNLKRKNWGVSANYAFRGGTYGAQSSNIASTNFTDSSLIFSTYTNRLKTDPSHSATLDFDFNLSSKTKLGINGGLNSNEINHNKLTKYDWLYSTGYDSLSNRYSDDQGTRKGYNTQLSLDHEVSKKSKIGYLAQYINSSTPRGADFIENEIEQRESRDFSSEELINQLDYSLSFKLDTDSLAANYTFESGLKTTHRSLGEGYIFYDKTGDVFIANSKYSNVLNYQEEVYAAYLMLTRKWKGWTAQFGLRAEDTRLSSQVSNSSFQTKMFNWFPSFYLGKELDMYNTLSFSYSKRIKRPDGRMLNPIPSYSNPFQLRIGNEKLIPERSHLSEISYLKVSEKVTLNTTLFYQYRDDRMGRLSYTDTNGITTVQWINFNYHQTLGWEFFTNWRITKWLTNVNTFTLYRTWVDGENFREGYTAIYTGYDIKNNITIKPLKAWTINLIGNYNSSREAVVGQVLPRYYMDLSVNYSFLKDKANLSLRYSDIFKTQYFRINTDVDNWNREVKYDWESNILWIAFSYKFGFQERKGHSKQKSSRDSDAF